jgi:hypothetical protein
MLKSMVELDDPVLDQRIYGEAGAEAAATGA